MLFLYFDFMERIVLNQHQSPKNEYRQLLSKIFQSAMHFRWLLGPPEWFQLYGITLRVIFENCPQNSSSFVANEGVEHMENMIPFICQNSEQRELFHSERQACNFQSIGPDNSTKVSSHPTVWILAHSLEFVVEWHAIRYQDFMVFIYQVYPKFTDIYSIDFGISQFLF